MVPHCVAQANLLLSILPASSSQVLRKASTTPLAIHFLWIRKSFMGACRFCRLSQHSHTPFCALLLFNVNGVTLQFRIFGRLQYWETVFPDKHARREPLTLLYQELEPIAPPF